jgi:glucose-fructose oxidoreductase
MWREFSSGKLGDLRILASEFSQQVTGDNVRVTEVTPRGGGPVYDMGVYCINAARYLFRAEPTEILAASANNGGVRMEPTIGLEPMTCRLRIRFGESP